MVALYIVSAQEGAGKTAIGAGLGRYLLGAGKKVGFLRVISGEKDGKICCLMLIKADEFGAMVKDLLGPLMQDIIAGEK